MAWAEPRPDRRVPARLRPLSEGEAAWPGAFFDAEGTVIREDDGRKYRLKVVNTEVEFLSAFLRLTGIGSLWFKPRQEPHHMDGYVWGITARNDVEAFVEALRPYSLKVRLVDYSTV